MEPKLDKVFFSVDASSCILGKKNTTATEVFHLEDVDVIAPSDFYHFYRYIQISKLTNDLETSQNESKLSCRTMTVESYQTDGYKLYRNRYSNHLCDKFAAFNFMIISESLDKKLISHIIKNEKANINIGGNFALTSLHKALYINQELFRKESIEGQFEIINPSEERNILKKIQILLDLGAAINSMSYFDETVLHMAVIYDAPESVLEKLIRNGGLIYDKDNKLTSEKRKRINEVCKKIYDTTLEQLNVIFVAKEAMFFQKLPKELKHIIAVLTVNPLPQNLIKCLLDKKFI